MSPLDTILDEPLGSRSHVVTLRGAIDVDAAREVERRLRDLALEGKRTIVADLSGAEELTPSLLGALIRAQRSLSWRHGRLLLVCDSSRVRQRLAVVGLPRRCRNSPHGLEATIGPGAGQVCHELICVSNCSPGSPHAQQASALARSSRSAGSVPRKRTEASNAQRGVSSSVRRDWGVITDAGCFADRLAWRTWHRF